VIIGKSGNVEIVHVGFAPALFETQLRDELTELVGAAE
jgi:hypothetical protein